MVLEGATAGILKIGAGHIPATALPGDSGNVGIAAHRDTYFRPLRLVRDHDTIVLKTSRRDVALRRHQHSDRCAIGCRRISEGTWPRPDAGHLLPVLLRGQRADEVYCACAKAELTE